MYLADFKLISYPTQSFRIYDRFAILFDLNLSVIQINRPSIYRSIYRFGKPPLLINQYVLHLYPINLITLYHFICLHFLIILSWHYLIRLIFVYLLLLLLTELILSFPDLILSLLTKLQILQNSIERCIFNIPKYSHTHISQFLVKLHWLPVRHIILYKTLLLAHKAIHHDSPDYLASLLKLKLSTSTTTRSTDTFLLQLPPKHNLHSTNTRACAISVPYSWNTLPHPSVLHHQLQTSRNY